jgi:two-component system chemotaxis response regulator CheB
VGASRNDKFSGENRDDKGKRRRGFAPPANPTRPLNEGGQLPDLKILIVDDAVIYRQILTRIVSDFDGVELTGTAPNGRIALGKVALNPPDLVLLDAFMPELDGLETLKALKADYPQVDVVMLSGLDHETADLTVKALEAGALDFIPKPRKSEAAENAAELRGALSRLIPVARSHKYVRQIQSLSSTKPARPLSPGARSAPAPELPPAPAPRSRPGRIDVVAIGVSTGGPTALQEIIPRLAADFPVPILAVQHMPPMFTASLAERLNAVSAIQVREGANGEFARPGVMYLARGGRHMVARRAPDGQVALGLTDTPPVNSCRPSADVLLRSLGMVYDGRVLSVILTGMGNDGLAGVTALARRGGYALVQDRATSVVWGMPGAVVEAGKADEVVPLGLIADRISRLVSRWRHDSD